MIVLFMKTTKTICCCYYCFNIILLLIIIIILISQEEVSSFQQQQFTFSSSSSSSLMKKTSSFLLPLTTTTTSIIKRHNNNIGFDSLSSLSSSSLSSSNDDNDNDNVDNVVVDNDDDDDDGIIQLTNIDRVYVISDLHTDSLENLEWLRNKTYEGTRFGPNDLIIVAGDISHEIDRLQESFQLLLMGGSKVIFVPGNHEAWLHSRNDSNIHNSIEKLNIIKQACTELGVLTTGRTIKITSCGGSCGSGGSGTTSYDDDDDENNNNNITPEEEEEEKLVLWIVPLESWYDATLTITNCEDLCDDFHRWPWVDFIKCVWPKEQFPFMVNGRNNQKIPLGLTEYFINKNQKVIKQLESSINYLETATTAKTTTSNKPTTTTAAGLLLQQQQQQQQKVVLLTVSHFLPNQQCLPDWKDLKSTKFDRENWLTHGAGGNSAKFAKVAGTQLLDDQIRNIDNNNNNILSSSSRNNNNNNNIRRIHLFGHSHRPKDFEYNGIRYIHNPLGKPREREMHLVSPTVDFQLLWDTRRKRKRKRQQRGGDGQQQQQQQQRNSTTSSSSCNNDIIDNTTIIEEKEEEETFHWGEIKANETIIRYWEEKGGGVELLKERMKKTKRRNRYDHKHMKKMKNMMGGSSSSTSSSSSSLKRSSSVSSSSSSSSSSSRFISSSTSRKSDDTK